MSDTWITQLEHYLDEDGEIPPDLRGQAKTLATYFSRIVEHVTSKSTEPLACRRRPGHRPCPGEINAEITSNSDDPQISWECSGCGDRGVLSGWTGTRWDRRRLGTIVEFPTPPRRDDAPETDRAPPLPSACDVIGEFARTLPHDDFDSLAALGELLMYLKEHGRRFLDEAELDRVEFAFSQVEEGQLELSELMGAGKILEMAPSYLRTYLIEEVKEPTTKKVEAVLALKDLVVYMGEMGYVPKDSADSCARDAADMSSKLPPAEKAARILLEAAASFDVDPARDPGAEFVDFDSYEIVELGADDLHLRGLFGARSEYRVCVPRSVAELVKPSFRMSCALARLGGVWQVVEVGHVYPN